MSIKLLDSMLVDYIA